MAGYTPPNSKGIPFKFTDAGYAKPTFNPTNADFHPDYSVSNLKAAIQVMGIYQESTYTYKKHCPTYVVGYSSYGVQIIKGPCVYGGIRDLGAFIEVKQKQQGSADLSAFLKQLIGSEVPIDLPAFIKSYEYLDLPAAIRGFDVKDLSAFIDTHPPSDIKAYLRVFQRAPKDLPASLYGWQASDLNAILEGLIPKDLPASLYGIPPKDLPAYLKVWPEDYLYASVHGWNTLDLNAYIKGKPYSDLGGIIGAHPWVELPARLKGWVREAHLDLTAYIRAFQYKDLQAYIFAYEIKDLPTTIIPIPYVRLYAQIHGWQEVNLGAILNGKDYPYNLTASIMARGEMRNLSARIKSTFGLAEYTDLSSNIHPWDHKDLSASLVIPPYGVLSAEILPVGFHNLPASIFPKMIKLTTILGIVTLNNKDLQAMINVSCGKSMFVNLPSSITSVFKKDLGAYVKGIKFYSHRELSAYIGRTLFANTLDKLPIRIIIESGSAMSYDKLPITFDLFRASADLATYVIGIPLVGDLSASIKPVPLADYQFEHRKSKVKVYKPRSEQDRSLILNKVVEFSFVDAVTEYLYLSAGDRAFAHEFLDKWAMGVKGFSPENKRLMTKRKLFRAATLYDIRKYNSVDAAIRDMVEFVTWEPAIDLGAVINTVHNSMAVHLKAHIRPIYIASSEGTLSASIVGNLDAPVAVGYEDDAVDLIG